MKGYFEFKNNSSSLNEKKILIKGYGKVGSRLAQFCKEEGAFIEVVDFEQNRSLIENDGYKFLKNYKDTSFNEINIFSPGTKSKLVSIPVILKPPRDIDKSPTVFGVETPVVTFQPVTLVISS